MAGQAKQRKMHFWMRRSIAGNILGISTYITYYLCMRIRIYPDQWVNGNPAQGVIGQSQTVFQVCSGWCV